MTVIIISTADLARYVTAGLLLAAAPLWFAGHRHPVAALTGVGLTLAGWGIALAAALQAHEWAWVLLPASGIALALYKLALVHRVIEAGERLSGS